MPLSKGGRRKAQWAIFMPGGPAAEEQFHGNMPENIELVSISEPSICMLPARSNL